MNTPENFRVEGEKGRDGVFIIQHGKITNYYYLCIASSGMGWEHVSVTLKKREKSKWKEVERTCTWAEMCRIKSIFWYAEESVMQIHPPKSEWVSTHPYCLHLWKPVDEEIKRPPAILVGVQGDNVQSL